MNELIEKFKALIADAERVINDNDNRAKHLIHEASLVKASADANEARAAELSEREKAIAKIENVMLIEAESKQRADKARELMVKNDEKVAELALLQDEIEAKQDELDELISVYKAKDKALEAARVQLEEDRKNMRMQIIDELKNLK